jgi:GT2 family glycosyltransferase
LYRFDYQISRRRLDYEIILVENASGEDLSALAARSPRIKLIVSEENRGMGGGNNIGLAAAAGEYAFILNPDTIIQGDAPVVLLDYLKSHPEAGIVGPKLLNTDGSLQYSCARFPGFFMPSCAGPSWENIFPGFATVSRCLILIMILRAASVG